jgi:LysR family glycine cleavage system transcriptional activator
MTGRPTRLPPLDELRAFEAVARHLSFAAAADEMNLTPSAISHRIRRLEEHFRTRLFRRLNPGVALTEEGRILLAGVEAGFGRLAQASKRVRSRSGRRTLTIFARPSFATFWLTPRLPAFLDAHPDIEPMLIGQEEGEPNFDGDGVDIAAMKLPGTHVPAANEAVLCGETVAMVCSPKLITNERPLSAARDLLHHQLIQIDQDLAPCFDWDWWIERYGLADLPRPKVIHVSHTAMAIEAARGGQGVAIVGAALASRDLATGTLMRPLPDEDTPMLGTYFLRWPEAASSDEVVMALRNYLVAEAGGGVTPTSRPD